MTFDIVVLLVLLVSALIAFFRGFIREVLTIVGVVGGFFAALWFGKPVSLKLQDWFSVTDDEGEMKELFGIVPFDVVMNAVAYGSIFILVVVILSIASYFISKSIEAAGMGALDRTFGVLFGLLRGIILLALLYLPIYILFDQDNRDQWFDDFSWLQGSKTRIYVEKTAEMIQTLIPQDFKEDMKNKQTEMDEKSEAARSKLEAIDVLKAEADKILNPEQNDTNETENGSDSGPSDNTDQTPSGEQGYNDTQTDTLNKLIEQEYNE